MHFMETSSKTSSHVRDALETMLHALVKVAEANAAHQFARRLHAFVCHIMRAGRRSSTWPP